MISGLPLLPPHHFIIRCTGRLDRGRRPAICARVDEDSLELGRRHALVERVVGMARQLMSVAERGQVRDGNDAARLKNLTKISF